MARHTFRRRPDRRGASVAEFAIVAPLLVLLGFGLIEFGRMVHVQQILTNAAREGARFVASESATSTTTATSAVQSYLASAGVSGATIAFTPSDVSTAQPGDEMECEVSVTFDDVSWLPTPMYISGATLSGIAVMRREGIQ